MYFVAVQYCQFFVKDTEKCRPFINQVKISFKAGVLISILQFEGLEPDRSKQVFKQSTGCGIYQIAFFHSSF
jgi:hypothetical protein